MPFRIRLFLCGFSLWSCFLCCAATLTFVAQPASVSGDNTWFNAVNWFTTDNSGNLIAAGRVPQVDEAAIITGTVDLQAGGVRVAILVATNNAAITNGTVAVENLQLLSGSSFRGATVNVLTSLAVMGTNCTLNGTALNILSIASGVLRASSPGSGSSLVLTQGSVLSIGGALTLNNGAQIVGGGTPQSKVAVQASAALICANSGAVIGSPATHLAVDNSGVVRSDSGSFVFTNGIDWQSSAGLGEFRAASPSSLILFSDPFHAGANVTMLFTGMGKNTWLSGATVEGIIQVSVVDPATQLAGPGTLELTGAVGGNGTLHLLGTTNQGGVAIWDSGSISLPGIAVDDGASFLIGAPAAECQLAGCTITNLGTCIFHGGNLDFAQGAILNNLASAMVSIQSDGTFSSSPGSGAFNNFGTVQKISPATTAFGNSNSISGPDFNNSGLLDVRSGQINLLGGASSGEFRESTGASIWFWGGTHALNNGATFTGAASTRISQGMSAAKCLLNESIALAQLEVGANGTLDCSRAPAGASAQIATLLTHDNAIITNATIQAGSFQMLDQSLIASTALTVGSTAVIAGSNCVFAGSTFNNSGACSLVSGVLTLAKNSVINNAQNASFTLKTNVSINKASTVDASTINNAGGFLVADPGVCTVVPDFSNSGRLEIQSGTLSFQDAVTQSQGATVVDGGATLGGTNLNVLGGSVSGAGTIAANVINAGGAIQPGAPVGKLGIAPDFNYQQASAAVFAAELGGSAPGQFSQLAAGGAAILDGQLVVTLTNGFAPQPGQVFQILTAGSVSGKFAQVLVPSSNGTTWLTRYGTNDVSLVLVANPTLPIPTISGGAINLMISTTAGVNYQVQAADQLNPPNWQNLDRIQGDGRVKTISETRTGSTRFYRVLIQ